MMFKHDTVRVIRRILTINTLFYKPYNIVREPQTTRCQVLFTRIKPQDVEQTDYQVQYFTQLRVTRSLKINKKVL